MRFSGAARRTGPLGRAAAVVAIAVALAVAWAGTSFAADHEITFRVTKEAGVRAFTKGLSHFSAFTEYNLTKQADDGSYEVWKGTIPDGKETFHYVAGGGGTDFLKTAQVVYLGRNEGSRTITVDVEKLNPSRREDNGFRSANMYLNVNDAQHLKLGKGGTFRLAPIRTWQVMEGFTDNYFFEPDYKVEVLGDAGAVKYEWKGAPGFEYAELTGLAAGVAVLRITYGPVKLLYSDGGGMYYNAVDPINTGVVVVTVTDGAPGADAETNISAREYDTIYFDKAVTDHAGYSFKPASGAKVRVHKPIHAGGASWGAGWSDGAKGADGAFTVNLYEGRNIVEVEVPGAPTKEYHVINAKGASINVKNTSNPSWKDGDAPAPGDELEISFTGIKTPLEKLAGIYNPGFPDTCWVSYKTPQGEVARSEGTQYDLAFTERNAITVTVPSSGKVKLTNGTIHCGLFGDLPDSHRKRPGNEDVFPNLNAKNYDGLYFDVLPDVTLPREASDGNDDTGGSDKGGDGGDGGGGCDAGAGRLALATLIPLAVTALAARRSGARKKAGEAICSPPHNKGRTHP